MNVRRRGAVPGRRMAFLLALVALTLPSAAGAQPALGGGAGMPNMRAISGKPLPDRGMALGTVMVRVARKNPGNAVAKAEITALVEAPGGEMRKRTATTDDGGRALFESLPVGHQFHAEVTVDGEKLTTDTFAVPDGGGVRVMLIGGLGDTGDDEGADADAQDAPAGDSQERRFRMGFISGTVKRDPDLPVATVEVSAVDESGRPLANDSIELGYVRAGSKIEVLKKATNAEGIVRFVGVGGGEPTANTGAAVVMQYGALRLGTDGFGIPSEGGIRVDLRVPQRTADSSVITIGAGGRLILQLRDDAVSFIETLPLENTSDKLFDPGPGGVEIRLPSEFVNAEAAEGEHKIEVRKGVGVAVHGIIAPRHAPSTDPTHKSPDEVTFGFVMPQTGSTRSFEQTFPTGMGEFTFITDQLAGLTIDSTQITGRQDRELSGKKYWLMRGEAIPPGGTLRFTVRGLPAPDNTGRTIAAALALALLATALVFGRRDGSAEKAGSDSERDKLVDRREKLFAELVAVESRDVGARALRGELVQKLESVYREIAAVDERRAV